MQADSKSEQMIEAVPNFSEGRRTAVIEAIVAAVQAEGVFLLDRSSDWDHNRTVITIAGSPEAVVEGLFRAVEVAARHINLFEDRGVHPRMGAADVVPLIPWSGITLDECVVWARALGRRIGEELQLPVYLYEAAATRPERRNLADVRRGEFEVLLETIHTEARRPDYGPPQIGPAGAVIVGARPLLIAYNIFLNSDDVATAQRIARQIRASSGGLPAVKALGLLVNGQAQVSLNLVDFTQTPLHVVFEAVSLLARKYEVTIDRSELIGLVPQEAIFQAASHYLKLPALTEADTIEGALAHAQGEAL
jgi:glutamate formiminotransferase